MTPSHDATGGPDAELSGPAATVRRWCEASARVLEGARHEINRLNVYPVADSDTGTNLALTFAGARDAADREYAEAIGHGRALTLDDAVGAVTGGALLSARGNSGAIAAQMLRSAGRSMLDSAADDAGARVAEACEAAARGAYEAVGQPVEGTMLTVMAEAGSAAAACVAQRPDATAAEVAVTAARAADEALARTSDQLEALRRAGVVDAGGRGLCLVLNVLADILGGGTGDVDPGVDAVDGEPVAAPGAGDQGTGDEGPDDEGTGDGQSPAFEVMYLLDAGDAAVARLRGELEPLGDSLVIIGGEGLFNVHVHVDDAGAAIEAGIAAGRPHRIRVTHLAEGQDHTHRHDLPAAAGSAASGRRVVACTAGPGIAGVFDEAGAVTVPVESGSRVSDDTLVEAVLGCGASEVVVLPNAAASIPTAEAAADQARRAGLRVTVIPTRAQVQGLAALAVSDPSVSFDDEVAQMSAAAGHTRTGAVTFATTDAMTMAGPCRVGQCLGVVDGDFAVVGDDVDTVARQVFDRVSGGTGELVTLLVGAESDADASAEQIADRLAAYAERTLPLAEVMRVDGGQDRYPVLIGVE